MSLIANPSANASSSIDSPAPSPSVEGSAEEATPRVPVVLNIARVSKRFGAFTALDDVSLDVRAGEIHCLLGENGAGKSTLCNVVFGVHRADAGALHLHGERFQPLGPAHALASGIAMVHQHFSLVGNMTAIENMMLGGAQRLRPRTHSPRARPDGTSVSPVPASAPSRPRELQARVEALAAEFGLAVDLQRPVEDLSVGERQRIEVLKCLLHDPRLLVLDEPTAVLPPPEVKGLLAMCRQVAARGYAVVLVTHKLAEIAEIATRTTVLRRGRVIETVVMRGAESDLGALVRSMVGREVRALDFGKSPIAGPPDPVGSSNDSASTAETDAPPLALVRAPTPGALQLRDLVVRDESGVTRLEMSLEVAGGEIVGLAGVEGNGQTQLGMVLAGLLRPTSGSVSIDGHVVTGMPPRALTARGVGIVPEDRHAVGCHLGLTVAENLFLGDLGSFTRFGLLRRQTLTRAAESRMTDFDVRADGAGTLMSSLSGGNQQKVVLARELSLPSLRFLLAAQPTRGLDVGAVESVYTQIRAARDRGAGVLLVSSELDELIAVADRVLVIYKGRIVGALPARPESREQIGALMSGRRLGEQEGALAS